MQLLRTDCALVQNLIYSEDRYALSIWFFIGGVTGCDCDYRNLAGPVVAGGAECARGGPAIELPEQSEAIGAGVDSF